MQPARAYPSLYVAEMPTAALTIQHHRLAKCMTTPRSQTSEGFSAEILVVSSSCVASLTNYTSLLHQSTPVQQQHNTLHAGCRIPVSRSSPSADHHPYLLLVLLFAGLSVSASDSASNGKAPRAVSWSDETVCREQLQCDGEQLQLNCTVTISRTRLLSPHSGFAHHKQLRRPAAPAYWLPAPTARSS